METKIQQKVITVTEEMSSNFPDTAKIQKSISPKKILQFVEKLKAMPDIRSDLPEKSLTKQEKFLQKILEEIGSQ